MELICRSFIVYFLLVYFIDSYVESFFTRFNKHYQDAINTDFTSLSLQEQIQYINHLNKVVNP